MSEDRDELLDTPEEEELDDEDILGAEPEEDEFSEESFGSDDSSEE